MSTSFFLPSSFLQTTIRWFSRSETLCGRIGDVPKRKLRGVLTTKRGASSYYKGRGCANYGRLTSKGILNFFLTSFLSSFVDPLSILF